MLRISPGTKYEPSKNEPSKIFKGCLPQILLGPFLNTLTHLIVVLGEAKLQKKKMKIWVKKKKLNEKKRDTITEI